MRILVGTSKRQIECNEQGTKTRAREKRKRRMKQATGQFGARKTETQDEERKSQQERERERRNELDRPPEKLTRDRRETKDKDKKAVCK